MAFLYLEFFIQAKTHQQLLRKIASLVFNSSDKFLARNHRPFTQLMKLEHTVRPGETAGLCSDVTKGWFHLEQKLVLSSPLKAKGTENWGAGALRCVRLIFLALIRELEAGSRLGDVRSRERSDFALTPESWVCPDAGRESAIRIYDSSCSRSEKKKKTPTPWRFRIQMHSWTKSEVHRFPSMYLLQQVAGGWVGLVLGGEWREQSCVF